ncbi:lycopene beta-cyclase CrtY [Pseudoduganella umbonata]|uniref:Lycopene beta-cyclase n=1 Tax=Pseudoduganella umbonata TaxID=864828 RepID=A0A4P8HT60_9BURK|nr:lycopene beta-cyclase CrtY [Pseudoduganella umbonata]MBB3222991.1 lycopene beta-cyclase [Pseudoduganella umbonata]QCP13103.1 lycopene beta-cyclase CrtY [Pseudoduganella umbonata]
MSGYDIILAGGGLANGLLAWRLRTHRPELRILLLEQGDALGGNHTWSFHDGDLDTAQKAWLAPLVGTRWPGYDVVFPDYARTLDSGYASIASGDFARVIEPALGPALRLGARIDEVTPTTVRLAGGELLSARAVIDGRGMRASARLALGYQTFLGQEVRLQAPHGLARPVIMDAGVAQQGGYRFVYLLPFGADRLLIEDTHYVDTAAWEPERLRANIAAYAGARGWRIAEVLREEHGSLPIVLAGDVDGYWNDLAGQPCTGLRAGLFHPTTGYSLPHAVRLAERIAQLPEPDAPALFAAIRQEALAAWRGQRFFRLLNRMLFLAGEPDRRWRVMQRFYTLPPGLVARFYAGRPTLADMARVLTGKPPVPVGAAVDAAFRTHPDRIHSRINRDIRTIA